MSAATLRIGQRFGRLVVIGDGARLADGHKRYQVRCDCGAVCSVRTSSLTQGLTQSCGCLRIERGRVNIQTALAQSVPSRFGRRSA
jgi:hypothetical protein